MSLDLNNIDVLNYNQSNVFANGVNENTYIFAASKDGIHPTVNTMPLTDVKAIFNNSDAFQLGILTFEDEYKAEIFKELRMNDWENILTNQQIEDILRHPTAEGLKKIVEIKEVPYFDRVRAIFFRLMAEDAPIIAKVKDIVDVRHRELQMRKRKSDIEIMEKDIPVDSDKTKELEEQNAALQAQLDEQNKKMEEQNAKIDQLIAMMAKQQDEISKNVFSGSNSNEKKNAGRPKKS